MVFGVFFAGWQAILEVLFHGNLLFMEAVACSQCEIPVGPLAKIWKILLDGEHSAGSRCKQVLWWNGYYFLASFCFFSLLGLVIM